MDIKAILSRTDHTLLSVGCTEAQILALCDEAMEYCTASVCIPPCFVKAAKQYVGDKTAICTVIGFPNGYNSCAAKVAEAADAVKNGADELDMVINVGLLKSGDISAVEEEIRLVKAACGEKILKVIVETCLLTEAEIIQMCKTVADGGADYIKTSTGFSKGGATLEDIRLMKTQVPKGLKIKAAGGISTLEDAAAFIAAGADRLGSSRIVKLCKEIEAK